MGRKKATMALIANRSLRKATFRNRKASLMKKARELSLLCGQPVFLAVSDGSDDPSPEYWPPTEAAAAQALFRTTAVTSQEMDSENLQRQVTDMQAQLKDLDQENLNMEAEEQLITALSLGPHHAIEVASSDQATRLHEILNRRMKEIDDEIQSLLAATDDLLCLAPDAEMVQPTVISSEDGMAPVLEESMRIDYDDICISFDPSGGDYLLDQHMRDEMPGLFEVPDEAGPEIINLSDSDEAC